MTIKHCELMLLTAVECLPDAESRSSGGLLSGTFLLVLSAPLRMWLIAVSASLD